MTKVDRGKVPMVALISSQYYTMYASISLCLQGRIFPHSKNQRRSVKPDSMWQHRLTRPLHRAVTFTRHVQHTYYRIIYKQNSFTIISRGVQR